MKRIALSLAGLLALGASIVPAAAFELDEFGSGERYSEHLSPYDGRPLGPPVTAFGPVYDDGDPRSSQVPRYGYYNGQAVVTLPQGGTYRVGPNGQIIGPAPARAARAVR